jgi:hypothetical protein
MKGIGPERTPLAAIEQQLLEQTEIERIERWRAEELERAGYEPRAAGRLAVRHDVDLHFAVELLNRGCAPALALRILL